MAKLLIVDGDDMHLEMTAEDWRNTHQDFKSEPRKPKFCLFLVTGHGTCSLPVTIVKEQNLQRRLKRDVRDQYARKVAQGTIVTLKDQGNVFSYVLHGKATLEVKTEDLEVV